MNKARRYNSQAAAGSQETPFYVFNETTGTYRRASERQIIAAARRRLAARLHRDQEITSVRDAADYLAHYFANYRHEAFVVLFLDNRHRLITLEELFVGTIDGGPVYPREIARRCLELGAAAVILSHNHPSGVPKPSVADLSITGHVIKALELLDIRTLDHVIIGGAKHYSFANHGKL